MELEAKSVLVGPNDGKPSFPPLVADSGLSLSPSASDVASVPMDESMSTCESLNSPDIEFVDNGCSSAVASLERKTSSNLHISEAVDTRKGDQSNHIFFFSLFVVGIEFLNVSRIFFVVF